jgi:hypothetical protein
MKAKGLSLLFIGCKVPMSEMEKLMNELIRDELILFVQWIIKDQEKITESDIWISADTVDEYLKTKL